MTNRDYILIVEDDPAIRWTVASVLQSEGYLVRAAENGEVALGLITPSPPALILLDMQMPVMDGWTFAARLKERLIGVPVVVMTAARDSAEVAKDIRAAAYLSKPFDVDDLLAVVSRFNISRQSTNCP